MAVGTLGTEYENERIRVKHGVPPSVESNQCAWLLDGRCRIYEDRPLVCRLWGAVRESVGDAFICPHGCGTADPVTWAEAMNLWQQNAEV